MDQEKLLGATDPETIDTMISLTGALFLNNQEAAAVEFGEELQRRVQQMEHTDPESRARFVSAIGQLAAAYSLTARKDAALNRLLEAEQAARDLPMR